MSIQFWQESLKIHIPFFVTEGIRHASRCLISEEEDVQMYKFTHYRVLFAKMLIFPYSKDIQPQYLYNYCRITLSCPLSKMLWFPLNHLQVLQRHGRYPMDSTTCPLSPCPTQDLFIRFQAVMAQLCSQLGIPHLPRLLLPSLQGPGKVAAGGTSWWERRQRISLASTRRFEGPPAGPDRRVQPVTQPPALPSPPAGKMPQRYAQLLRP